MNRRIRRLEKSIQVRDEWDRFINTAIEADEVLNEFRQADGTLTPIINKALTIISWGYGVHTARWILVNRPLLIRLTKSSDKLLDDLDKLRRILKRSLTSLKR
jgi:hypothetical protein